MNNWLYILLLLLVDNIAGAQKIFVSSRNTNSVKQYDLNGNAPGDFVTANSGGLSLPQEVVWHPNGFLLVTGRGNTAIKKYDGITGEYLGNFTTGYALDNPTKTTVWRDSLLYVSQWGISQNKVVRFDFNTGAFVDEFTNVGVPTGGSHAWDKDGNLYVAQWMDGQNGKVSKFDTAGNFVSTFIPTSLLDGPVNLWFDNEGNLFVLDWSRGDLLKFNGTTGAFISTVFNTSSQLEGYAFDSEGRLYLGDWGNNKVHRYNFEINTLDPFIETGGLLAPNSILILEKVSSTMDEDFEKVGLSISPNPASEVVRVNFYLEKTADLRVEMLDVFGQRVATLFSGKQVEGEHEVLWDGKMDNGLRATPGVYFFHLIIGTKSMARSLVWH